MEFRILGPLEVSAGDGAIKLGGPKQRAVLAHLILRADHPVPIDRLIDGLWGEKPPQTARNTLQTYVYRLRQVLGDDRISSEAGGYALQGYGEVYVRHIAGSYSNVVGLPLAETRLLLKSAGYPIA